MYIYVLITATIETLQIILRYRHNLEKILTSYAILLLNIFIHSVLYKHQTILILVTMTKYIRGVKYEVPT